MISQPIKPKIAAQLEDWESSEEQELEIDRSLVDSADFTHATKITIDASKLQRVLLTGAVLDRLQCSDTAFSRLEAAALRAYKTSLLRVSMTDCRLTGTEFAEANFEDCTFTNVKFDEAGFRFASFKRVRFENCMLRSGDFSNAKLSHVTFSGCDLEQTNFIAADCHDVDVSTEDLTVAKGILGLKGSTISTEQLMQLAPLLATELGFRIKE